ncbi:hypothetical protein [Pseudoclavibacter helvolus]|uniref:hypothetical protein n=1 Tax=Pseudoclavibacter helvolus TaxID=255205 RepID=UPI003C789998
MIKPVDADPFAAWLRQLNQAELLDMVADVADNVPGAYERMERHRERGTAPVGTSVASIYDNRLSAALELVNDVLTPTRQFYDYRDANDYADDGEEVVELLRNLAEESTPALLSIIERALTLATRAILRSDDSSGLQSQLVGELMDAHERATITSSPPLTQAQQTRLVKWLINFRYGGQQDFFDPDIVAYAPALTPKSIEQYRAAIAKADIGEYGSYPLRRLAVLDRDAEAIVAAHGGPSLNAFQIAPLLVDLVEAGHHDHAVDWARRGLEVNDRSYGGGERLLEFLIADAQSRGDQAAQVTLQRDWFRKFPSHESLKRYRSAAASAGLWDAARAFAEKHLAASASDSFIRYLLEEGRDDEAWQFATEHYPADEPQYMLGPSGRDKLWQQLCVARVRTHPADTLPHYRRLVTKFLKHADVSMYPIAAAALLEMRAAATAAGATDRLEFDEWMLVLADENKRRPRCLQEFRRTGLIVRAK